MLSKVELKKQPFRVANQILLSNSPLFPTFLETRIIEKWLNTMILLEDQRALQILKITQLKILFLIELPF